MSSVYNNIPNERVVGSSDATTQFFQNYYTVQSDINSSAVTEIKGYFETKGFQSDSAESVAIIIVSQAKRDNLNPFEIIDTLKGLTEIEISALVAEILNYNRYKSSSLGITKNTEPNEFIRRNIKS